MADKQDVTGVWYGRYEADEWDETNGFIAVLEETGGAITGVRCVCGSVIRSPSARAQCPVPTSRTLMHQAGSGWSGGAHRRSTFPARAAS